MISVDPPEAEMTPYGGPVTILVSQGPETFPVPTLTGLSPGAAEGQGEGVRPDGDLLRRAGHAHSTVVISQIPTAGTIVHAGDTITLYVA